MELGSKNVWVEVCSSGQLNGYFDAWQNLADNASVPNVFLEPWHFTPAINAYGDGKDSIFVVLWQQTGPPHSFRHMIGFIPLERVKGYPLQFGTVVTAWKHRNLFLNAPLLRKGVEEAAWTAFLDWFRESNYSGTLIELPSLLAEGPAYWRLIDVLHRRGDLYLVLDQYTRALLVRDDTPTGSPTDGLSSGARKELRRQRRRLTDLGKLELRILTAGEDVQTWVDKFMALEASGWKGRGGSAFKCDQREVEYLSTICKAAHDRGKLQMLGLFLDGQPISMKCNFLSCNVGFAFKIAYEEKFASYSPGVLLELDMMDQFRDDATIRSFDSCASPTHVMIKRLWRHRQPMAHLLISSGSVYPNLRLGLYFLMRSIKKTVLALKFRRQYAHATRRNGPPRTPESGRPLQAHAHREPDRVSREVRQTAVPD